MANQTDEKKEQMVAGAGVNYQSLAQGFEEQLEKAKGTASRVEALAPGQESTAKMIGDTSQLPSGMSPTQTIARGNMAANSFAAAQVQHGQQNVIEIMTQMMNLQQQKETSEYQRRQIELAEKDFRSTLHEKGMVWDEELNEPR